MIPAHHWEEEEKYSLFLNEMDVFALNWFLGAGYL